MTLEELEKLCAEWQKIIRVQDWNVTLRICRFDELENCYGDCNYHTTKKEAIIRLLDENDRRDTFCPPIEKTLIHELIHLSVAPFWSDDKETELETHINTTADGYYTLKYANRGGAL